MPLMQIVETVCVVPIYAQERARVLHCAPHRSGGQVFLLAVRVVLGGSDGGRGKGYMSREINLADTIPLMTSDNYKDRFVAEYWQNEIRIRKLDRLLAQDRDGTLPFAMTRESRVLLKAQLNRMLDLTDVLEMRAAHEGIDLSEEYIWRLIKQHQTSTTE